MGPFLRWVVSKTLTHFAVHELAAFTDGSYSEETATAASPVYVVRLQIRYRVQRPGLQDDVDENVLHFINTGGTLPGAAATDVQKAAAETAWDNFWTSDKVNCAPEVALQEYRWYHTGFDDPLSGPPTRVTTKATPVVGTGTNKFPQGATSLTMRTALRKHWGRIYLPGHPPLSSGLVGSTDVDTLATNFRTFIMACQAVSLTPVVFSKTTGSVFSIYQLEVDNVSDVIRRRRPKNSTYKKIVTS